MTQVSPSEQAAFKQPRSTRGATRDTADAEQGYVLRFPPAAQSERSSFSAAGEAGAEALSQSRKHDIPCYQWEERLIEKCV